MQITHITDYAEKMEKALAEIRDLFPIPQSAELHDLWFDAVSDPEAVPAYVKACIAASLTERQPHQAATVEDYKEATQDTFCDAFCTWRDHHPDCQRGK